METNQASQRAVGGLQYATPTPQQETVFENILGRLRGIANRTQQSCAELCTQNDRVFGCLPPAPSAGPGLINKSISSGPFISRIDDIIIEINTTLDRLEGEVLRAQKL